MGYEMAKNVRQKMPAQSTLFMNDVNLPACEKFVSEFKSFSSITISKSACEVAEKAVTIIPIVPADNHVREVYLNPRTGVVAERKGGY